MTKTAQRRRPDTDRHRSRPARRPVPARPVDKRRFLRRYAMILMALAYGSTVALLVVAVGLTTLAKDGVSVAQEKGPKLAKAGQVDNKSMNMGSMNMGSKSNGSAANPAKVRINARHLGNLVVDVNAKVTMNKPTDALTGAKVVAYADMVQMPGAHKIGPLPMQEVPNKPGEYHTQINVPMPGDFKIRVQVKSPVQAESTEKVPVTTTY